MFCRGMPMSLKNCKQCGKLYIQDRSPYCMDCKKVQDELYLQVREFLKHNSGCTVLDVHLQTGIPIAKLLELQKEAYSPF